MINITKPFLPPKIEYQKYIDEIWDRGWLTNDGPLVNELELKLKEYLGLDHLLFLGNGTIAIQLAIKALKLKGEIITTPFSYVATTSSIVWEGCLPVFVDIDKYSLNINPKYIEKSITEHTSAILATHIYGNPCEVEEIQQIADKQRLKVIYDAAHCFGTKYKGKSILEFGDVSTISFHATKLFHTIEGGAVVANNEDIIYRMSKMRNFGHDGPGKFNGVGINAKNSEFHAAMGLINLKYINEVMEIRKQQFLYYVGKLKNLNIDFVNIQNDTSYNYAYLAVIFNTEKELKNAVQKLNNNQIFPRRYFHPSLNKLEYLNYQKCPVAEAISRNVLCLPVYHELSNDSIDLICKIIKVSLD